MDAPKSDLFDVLAYVLFALPPKTREDRARTVRDAGLPEFDGELKELLMAILKAYEEDGESELGSKKLGHFLKARYGGVSESRGILGDLAGVREAYFEMQARLYRDQGSTGQER